MSYNSRTVEQTKKLVHEAAMIFQGDCAEIMRKEVGDGQAALIFADPPYNIGSDSR